jgi:hypothetical protein
MWWRMYSTNTRRRPADQNPDYCTIVRKRAPPLHHARGQIGKFEQRFITSILDDRYSGFSPVKTRAIEEAHFTLWSNAVEIFPCRPVTFCALRHELVYRRAPPKSVKSCDCSSCLRSSMQLGTGYWAVLHRRRGHINGSRNPLALARSRFF